MPAFPGGDIALAKYLNKIRYPKEQQDLQSKIDLSFVVDTDGNLLDNASGIRMNQFTLCWIKKALHC